MPDPSRDMLPPHTLARLLDLDAPAPWSQRDATAALRHQLAAPLLPDLAHTPGIEIDRLRPLAAPHATFLQLLTSPTPSLELLQALKQWARHVRDDPASPLAGAPATVLYYAAITAARTRLRQRITALTDDQLLAGIAWSRAYPGAQALTTLFDQPIV
jgi:hypothetical protein